METPDTGTALAHVFREESGRVLAALIAVVRDFDLAEDVFQDAIAVALERWPQSGVPDKPGAWLLTAARRKAIDRLRRRGVQETKLRELGVMEELSRDMDDEPEEIPDERLRLIFTCCHPALSIEAQVALTLRALGGLTTAEIARAFLVQEGAMARRLSRAKRKIRAAGVPYRVPPAELLGERAQAVLAVIYLIFNEGWAATSGDALIRRELCAEAIRLARLLSSLLDDPEVLGLLALMLLHDARRDARVARDGALVPLEQQDRGLWHGAQIDEGSALLERAAHARRPGAYQLQAAISAVHCSATSAEQTDWTTIVRLYSTLLRLQPSPVVALNRAAAISRVHGCERALALVDDAELASALADYQPWHATRADLLRRLGRREEAAESYRRALELTAAAAERAFLERQLAQVESALGA